MNKSLKIALGLFLIIVGAIGVLSSYDVVNFGFFSLWTYFVLGLGLLLEVSYFSGGKQKPGLLISGGILVVIGGMFVASSLISWRLMGDLWPFFIIAPGFGLLQAYVIHEKNSGYLIASAILVGFGLVFLNFTLLGFGNYILMSIALIGLGIVLIFKPGKQQHTVNQTDYNHNEPTS